MNLSNNVKNMRQKLGITQEELAAATSVSRQTIIAIEKGNYIPSLALAINLAKFFKVSFEELFYVK